MKIASTQPNAFHVDRVPCPCYPLSGVAVGSLRSPRRLVPPPPPPSIRPLQSVLPYGAYHRPYTLSAAFLDEQSSKHKP